MVNYHDALIEGRLIRRYKRFFVDIDVGDEIITAHCAMHTDTEPCTLFDCHAINQRA